MNKDLVRQLLTVVGLIIVLVVNILASLLPLNGLTTAQISDSFPVLFVPAGYVFSIWGIIYLGSIAFTVYQLLPSQREHLRLRKMGLLFFFSCLANALWLVSFHYQQFGLAMLLILVLLVILIRIYLVLDIGRNKVKPLEKWVVDLPFSIYLSWITVATVANVSQLLYWLHWDGFGLAPEVWTVIMLAVAVVLSVLMSFIRKDVGYTLVLVWAFIGIAIKQSALPLVSNAAWFSAVVITVILLLAILLKPNTSKTSSRY